MEKKVEKNQPIFLYVETSLKVKTKQKKIRESKQTEEIFRI